MKLSILKRINPKTSIYARVFIWFWLSLILIMGSTAYLARNIFFELTISELTPSAYEELALIEKDIQLHLEKESSSQDGLKPLEEWLVDYAQHNQLLLIAIIYPHAPTDDEALTGLDQAQNSHRRIVANAPTPVVPSELEVSLLSDQSSPKHFETGRASYYGPLELNTSTHTILLVRAIPKPLAWLLHSNQNSPKFVLVLALFLSALFCFVLVKTVLRPLANLREAVKQYSLEKPDYRINARQLGKDELGELGKQFNFMASRIEQQVQNQHQLLANISHEMKTPLARQSLAIDLLTQRIELNNAENTDHGLSNTQDKMIASSILRIQKENENLNYLIRNIITLSRYDSQHISHLQVFQLSTLVEEVIEDARYEKSPITIHYAPSIKEPLLIQANQEQLKSAIENVLRNALRYANDTVIVNLSQTDDNIVITIIDDGCGIENSELVKVLNPFHRVSSARERERTDTHMGAGLGLAIAKQSLDAHGGHIELKNNVTQGLTVTLTLIKSDVLFSQC